MIPHGVRLDQQKRASLKNGIVSFPSPEDLPAPPKIKPLKKGAAAPRILSAAEEAGIADEFDGMMLERKLSLFASRKTELLVACGFDEDPYTSGAEAVLRESAEDVAEGLRLAAKACGAKERLVAASSQREARRFAACCTGTAAVAAGNRYPARTLLMQKLRRGGKKAEWIGVQACAALGAAVRGECRNETVVTVAGDGVRRWGNFRVRIGTPVGDVLAAGKPEKRVCLVAVGSSVTGRTVTDLSLPVTAATRCVIALKRPPRVPAHPCVGCGRCARACPAGVLPWLVYRELEGGSPEALRLFHVEDCVGCGACHTVCPSGIDLMAAVRRAAGLKEGRDLHETE